MGVVYLVGTGVSASLPSAFSLHHPPLRVCLSPEQGRSSLRGRNNHQKTSLRPHAERLVRGRGPGVLSCPITSVPFSLQGMGGEGGTRPWLREDGDEGSWNWAWGWGWGGLTEMVVFCCQICSINQRDWSGIIEVFFLVGYSHTIIHFDLTINMIDLLLEKCKFDIIIIVFMHQSRINLD